MPFFTATLPRMEIQCPVVPSCAIPDCARRGVGRTEEMAGILPPHQLHSRDCGGNGGHNRMVCIKEFHSAGFIRDCRIIYLEFMNVSPETPVFIIGCMACGKTTFRPRARPRHGQGIHRPRFLHRAAVPAQYPRHFLQKGEDEFRRMEAAILREAGEFSNVVVACGGGTPATPPTWTICLAAG